MELTFLYKEYILIHMLTNTQTEIFNRVYSYEVAVLLANQPLSVNEIVLALPLENVHETQIRRTISALFNNGIVKVHGSRGPDKYYLNKTAFSEEELREINIRAVKRMTDSDGYHGKRFIPKNVPDEFYVFTNKSECERNATSHINSTYVASKWH